MCVCAVHHGEVVMKGETRQLGHCLFSKTDLLDAGNGDHGRLEEGEERRYRENPEPQTGAREKCHDQHQKSIGYARRDLFDERFLLPEVCLIGEAIERRHWLSCPRRRSSFAVWVSFSRILLTMM